VLLILKPEEEKKTKFLSMIHCYSGYATLSKRIHSFFTVLPKTSSLCCSSNRSELNIYVVIF